MIKGNNINIKVISLLIFKIFSLDKVLLSKKCLKNINLVLIFLS